MSAWTTRLAIAVGFTFQVGPAIAGVLTLDAVERGFITQLGATNPTNNPADQRDYLLGNCMINSCGGTGGGEYRNFLGFAIPALMGNIVSVELLIDTAGVDLSQAPSLTATYTSLSTTSSFAALGSGTEYGSIDYSAADAHSTLGMFFNATAITDVLAAEGGTLLIGGRATSTTLFDPASANQLVYEHSGQNNATQLIITTKDVPEPSTIALLGTGILSLMSLRRRKS